jgi:hypothetical protein
MAVMYGSLVTNASHLLDVLTEIRGISTTDPHDILSHIRSGSGRPSWPDVLGRLRGIEAALLQDMTWWGPAMQERLHQWSGEQRPHDSGLCTAIR